PIAVIAYDGLTGTADDEQSSGFVNVLRIALHPQLSLPVRGQVFPGIFGDASDDREPVRIGKEGGGRLMIGDARGKRAIFRNIRGVGSNDIEALSGKGGE